MSPPLRVQNVGLQYLSMQLGRGTPQQTDMGMIVRVFAKSKGAKHNSMESGTFETPSAAMARRDSALESCYAFCGGRE